MSSDFDDVLAGMSPAEIRGALGSIDELEQEDCVSSEEARAWRHRIADWQMRLGLLPFPERPELTPPDR